MTTSQHHHYHHLPVLPHRLPLLTTPGTYCIILFLFVIISYHICPAPSLLPPPIPARPPHHQMMKHPGNISLPTSPKENYVISSPLSLSLSLSHLIFFTAQAASLHSPKMRGIFRQHQTIPCQPPHSLLPPVIAGMCNISPVPTCL